MIQQQKNQVSFTTDSRMPSRNSTRHNSVASEGTNSHGLRSFVQGLVGGVGLPNAAGTAGSGGGGTFVDANVKQLSAAEKAASFLGLGPKNDT